MDASLALEKFKEFLNIHTESPKDMHRTQLSINTIRNFNKDLSAFILRDPCACIPWFEEELGCRVGFTGELGTNFTTPRSIDSTFLGKMVCVFGIVTSVSLVRPKLARSMHYCHTERQFYDKEYRDGTTITRLPTTNTIYPLTDTEGHPLASEFGLSEYRDFQTVQIQEVPENSPPGQLPRSIECVLSDDLVDTTKPGDRVKIFGVFKSFHQGNQFPSKFRTIIIANNVEKTRSVEQGDENEHKMEKFRLISQSDLKFKSVAPTIFGNDEIKKAIALMMVGGNELVMKNGSKIRGDINILLVGDPSTAKSQLLRYALNFMPLSIATTGRGSSGVGLTAAVVLDKETGDKRLEAGAMVLADRGLVCIDEFDKMNSLDRIAIHEVMEQQTVTIAKAGIHTVLNARCSVLAAANPVLGVYNEKMTVQENIRLPESLLTRFDLVFITLDEYDSEKDDRISKHVLRMHVTEDREGEIGQGLFKEFVMHARGLRPVLRHETGERIAREYARMRGTRGGREQVTAATPRLLETLIRLSTAHAKLRLSETVDEEDAEAAISLVSGNIVRRVAKTGETTLGDLIRGEKRERMREFVFEWKSGRPDQQCCTVEAMAAGSEYGVEELRRVVEELSNEKHLHYSDGQVFFFE